MEPREGRQSDAQGRPSRRAELVALLVAVIAAAILISLLFQVPFLQPILATPLAFADLLAIVSGASCVGTGVAVVAELRETTDSEEPAIRQEEEVVFREPVHRLPFLRDPP